MMKFCPPIMTVITPHLITVKENFFFHPHYFIHIFSVSLLHDDDHLRQNSSQVERSSPDDSAAPPKVYYFLLIYKSRMLWTPDSPTESFQVSKCHLASSHVREI